MTQQPMQQYGAQETTATPTTQSGTTGGSQQEGIGYGGQTGPPNQSGVGGQTTTAGTMSGTQGTGQTGGTQQTGQMGGMQGTGQMGGTQGTAGGSGLTLEDAITDEVRIALYDIGESARVCEWCADQCIDAGPGMAWCIRLCRDVADIAALDVSLLSRDSVFARELAETFVVVAEECAQECAQHSDRHCQECAEVLTRAVESTRTMLASFGGGGGGSGFQGQAGMGGVGSGVQSGGFQQGQSPEMGHGSQTGGQF